MVVHETDGLGLGRGRGSFRSSIRGSRGSTSIHEKVERRGGGGGRSDAHGRADTRGVAVQEQEQEQRQGGGTTATLHASC
jgi:hypothetical protein